MLGSPPVEPVHRSIPVGPRLAAAALLALAIWGALAAAGDLRERAEWYLPAHAVLVVLMLLVTRWAGRCSGALRWALAAALLFRLVASLGEPALSDDVYRYVWDGRVQAAGIHPYRHAPADPALTELRDDVWPRVNHPEVRTIYPPASQMLFAAWAGLGLGPTGFRLMLGIVDFTLVLALWLWLGRLKRPRHWVLLYAWNPLAVVETAGSGHVEPVAALALVLALAALRPAVSAAALAVAVQVKLTPIVAAAALARRAGWRWVLVFLAVSLLLVLPYAWSGPALPGGTGDFVERWEHNALVFPWVVEGLERLDPTPTLKRWVGGLKQRLEEGAAWDWLYRHVWPQPMARALVGALWLVLAVGLWRRYRDDPLRFTMAALAAALLLAPVVHPWYALWILPLAVVVRDRAVLLFAALVPLSYAWPGDAIPTWARLIEYLPLLGAVGLDLAAAVRMRR